MLKPLLNEETTGSRIDDDDRLPFDILTMPYFLSKRFNPFLLCNFVTNGNFLSEVKKVGISTYVCKDVFSQRRNYGLGVPCLSTAKSKYFIYHHHIHTTACT
jgi:hypothetical protein